MRPMPSPTRSAPSFDPAWLDRREIEAWFSAASRDAHAPGLRQRWQRFITRWQLGPCSGAGAQIKLQAGQAVQSVQAT